MLLLVVWRNDHRRRVLGQRRNLQLLRREPQQKGGPAAPHERAREDSRSARVLRLAHLAQNRGGSQVGAQNAQRAKSAPFFASQESLFARSPNGDALPQLGSEQSLRLRVQVASTKSSMTDTVPSLSSSVAKQVPLPATASIGPSVTQG